MKILPLILFLILFIPGVGAQWETHDITPPGNPGKTPVGASVETHPLTNAWVVLAAFNNATSEFSEVRALSSYNAWGDITDTFAWGDVRSHTEISIGGLSTSYTGMAFCLTQFHGGDEGGGDDSFGQLDLVWQVGNDYTDWNRAVIITGTNTLEGGASEDINGNNHCDTALPRYGWRTPPNIDLAWVRNLDIENNVRFVSLGNDPGNTGNRDTFLAGGSRQLSIDGGEYLIAPGSQFTNSFLIRDNIREPSDKCPLNIWWLGCAIAKTFDARVMGADVFKQQSTPDQATVDYHTRVVNCGVVQDITGNDRGVFSLENTYLQEQVGDEEKLASIAANQGSHNACTVAALDHWSHISMWQHPSNGIVRYRETSLGSGAFPIQEAFSHENTIREIHLKATDQDRSGSHLIGAFRDSQDEVWAFSSENRGKTWNKTLVATDFNDNNEAAGHNLDTAYDRHRGKQLVVYTRTEDVALAVRDLSFGVPPVRAPQDLRGLFGVPTEVKAGPNFLGIPLQPIADNTGWTATGAGYFIAFLLIYALMAGVWLHTRSPLLSVLGGGGLGLVLGFAVGAIAFWVIVAMGVLVAGGILFLASTFSGIGALGSMGRGGCD